MKSKNKQLLAAGACLGVMLGGAGKIQAQSQTQPDANSNGNDKITQLQKENEDLQRRLAKLETLAEKEGLMTSGATNADPPVSAMTDFSITGFVTTSYFHDTSEPPIQNGHVSPGYLWNRVNDSLSLNKIKLTFASPAVQASGDKFDVAYRVSFIAGQDAPIVNTKSGVTGFDYVREAYIEMNVPIGTGLNIKAGELISLMNYESGDGGAANNNFSQGFQWFFTGNPPEESVQLGYDFTDQVGLKFRVMNGMYQGPIDNNTSKSLMASLNLKPIKDLWVNLIAFGGREDAVARDVWGGSILAGYNVNSQFSLGTELDWFTFYYSAGFAAANAPVGAFNEVYGNNHVYSGGLWANYDFSKKVGLALRTEFLSDDHGVDASGGALGLMNPVGTGQDITSVALTLNYKPLTRVKIQPEIRFDHTSWSHGWDPVTAAQFSKQNRFLIGMGASYLF
jgi:hypothetical protein